MGTHFWWLYDVIAVVAVAVCIYLSGRKGLFKSAIMAVSCIVGIALVVPMSGAVSKSLYKTTIRDTNVNKLNKLLMETEISSYLGNALENMGYSVIVNTEKLDVILESDKDIDEQLYKYMNNINGKVVDNEVNFRTNLNSCYAEVMKKIISDDFSKYSVETASQKIRDGETDFGNLMRIIKSGEKSKEAAQTISDYYIADAYINVIMLITCIILFAIVFAIGFLTTKSLAGSRDEISESTGSHIAGGICGLFTGIAFIFIIAVVISLSSLNM